MKPKIKIKVDYKPPPPDPPDEICEICGGCAPGWWVASQDAAIAICLSCWADPMKTQRRFKISGSRVGIEEGLWMNFICAVSVLCHLEKEIASIKRHHHNEPRRFYG